VEVQKESVPLRHIEPDTAFNFVEIHRTEVQRPGVRFSDVVRPVYQAAKPHAALDAESI
jgi:hypothetical protein